MKLQQKIQAIDLRKSGRSYGEIRREIKVSKATLSLWLRDIVLTPEQEDRIYVEGLKALKKSLKKLKKKL